MAVRTIVTPIPPSARASRRRARDKREERLAGLDPERMLMSLAFLSGFRPAVFDAVLDAAEPCLGDEPDPAREPEPFCTECLASAGIFWLLGEEWQHFRPGGPEGNPQVYDPGHTPVIGWRAGGTEVPAPRAVPAPVI